MTYRALSSSLHDTADAAIEFFKRDFGLVRIHIEEALHTSLSYRPTFWAGTREHEIVCVEVSETAFPKSLDPVVLDCQNLRIPVKLYVALSKTALDPDYKANIARARETGVGIVEVDSSGGVVVYDALALSLTGCRRIVKIDFPTRLRPALVTAESTFRSGSPAKACSLIYDEIERITREVAKKSLKRGAWTKAKVIGHVPTINLDTDPWHNVLGAMTKHCDFKKAGCPGFTHDLMTRVQAVVGFRNQAGHKPRRLQDRIKRDSQLRTRFEGAVDLLLDVATACKGLRL